MRNANLLRATAALLALTSSSEGLSQTQIEEVIVTAQKREERLQDVPITMSVFGEQKLERLGVTDFADVARQVPGLTHTDNGRHPRGGGTIVIRGVQLGGDAVTTAFYVGETPLQPSEANTSRLGQPDPNMYDIGRIEVLKGPQGTLYGSSALGGVVRVLPNAPDPKGFYGKFDIDLNSMKYGGSGGDLNAMVNIPLLEDRLAARFVGYYAQDAGYIDQIRFDQLNMFGVNAGGPFTPLSDPSAALVGNARRKDVNSSTTRGGRAALQWRATDSLTITPAVYLQETRSDAGNWVSQTVSQGFKGQEPLDIDFGIREPNDTEYIVGNLLIDWDMGFGNLLSSSTLAQWSWANSFNATGILSLLSPAASDPVGQLNPLGKLIEPLALNDTGTEDHTVQELRFSSSFDAPVNFILGAFYREVKQDFNQALFMGSRGEELFGTPVLFNKSDEKKVEKESGVFLHVTWNVTDQLSVEGGARAFNFDRNEFAQADGVLGFAPTLEEAKNQDGVTPSFSVRYLFSDHSMVFARASQGYRRGFFSAVGLPQSCLDELASRGIDPANAGLVDPDTLWNYEIGARTSLADNRLSIGASAYQIKWDDIQVDLSLQCGFTLQSNAGKADIRGVEVDLQAVPFDGLTFSASAGYTDATVDTDIPALDARKGDRLPGSYKLNGAASLEYSRPLIEGRYRGFSRLDYTYTGSYVTTFSASSFSTLRPALGLANLSVGVQSDTGWEASIYVRNLANTVKMGMCGADVAFRLVQPDGSTCINRPLVAGIHFQKSFGMQ